MKGHTGNISFGEQMDNSLLQFVKVMLIVAFLIIEIGFFWLEPKSPIILVPVGVIITVLLFLLSTLYFVQASFDTSTSDDYRHFCKICGVGYSAGFMFLLAVPFVS